MMVEEDKRMFLKQQLVEFRNNDDESLRFPSTLTNTERKFIHKTAIELNLVSKSAGAGENRFITIWKRESDTAPISATNPAKKTIPWELGAKARTTFSKPEIERALELLEPFDERNLSALENAKNRRASTYRVNRLHDQLDKVRSSYAAIEAKRLAHPMYAELRRKRDTLPAAQYRDAVVENIKNNQIVLISGETGCGKSTQVPQFLLEDAQTGPVSRIVITQPRRISAISLAERIAFERGEAVGSMVGYNIRLESKHSAATQLLFVTPGVLLRKLLTDDTLEEFSHILVDEAHERDRFTEFLLIVLRDLCARRRQLKLVLMSATMHTQQLRAYFGDIPQIHVGGSVHPVQEFYLEHVLKFIRYQPRSLHDDSQTSLQQQQGYTCSICQQHPFLSPEELGTHAALCYPADVSHFVNHYLAQSQGQPGRYNHQSANKKLLLQQRLQRIRQQTRPVLSAPSSTTAASASAAAIADEEEAEEVLAIEDSGSEVDSDEEDEEVRAVVPVEDVVDAKDRFLRSDESSELNTLLKHYQRDLETLSASETEAAYASYHHPSSHPSATPNRSNAGNTNTNNSGSGTEVDHQLVVALLRYIMHSEFGHHLGSNAAASGAKKIHNDSDKDKGGCSVLVFLPGWDDIAKLHRLLSSLPDFSNKRTLILQLHSGIPRKDQNLIFQPTPRSHTKIILATNIAETSLTIDDVTVVIDSGLAKEKAYDPHTKLSYLKSTFISQAAARQRKGRAGRTQAGVCFKLYSVLRAQHLPAFQDSEILRMPLEELILQAKWLGLAGQGQAPGAAQAFLAKALDPPNPLAVTQALDLLISLHCLTPEGEALTPLGEVVAQLPLPPRMAKMLLLGCLVGCGPAAVSLGAVMSARDPFLLPTSDQQRAQLTRTKMQLSANSLCDQISVLRALEVFSASLQRMGRGEAQRVCEAHDLSYPTMLTLHDTTQQLDRSLKDSTQHAQLDTAHHRHLRNLGSLPLIAFTLSAGLYPDFGLRTQGQTLFLTEKGAKAKIHPASVNSKAALYKNECRATATSGGIEALCFQDLVALNPFAKSFRIGGAAYSMLSTAPLSVLGLCLIAGSLEVSTATDTGDEASPVPPPASASTPAEERVVLVIDGWIRLEVSTQDAVLLQRARQILQRSLVALVTQPTLVQQSNSVTQAIDLVLQTLVDAQQDLGKLNQHLLASTSASSGSGGRGGGRGGGEARGGRGSGGRK